jgi:hypothetical protein
MRAGLKVDRGIVLLRPQAVLKLCTQAAGSMAFLLHCAKPGALHISALRVSGRCMGRVDLQNPEPRLAQCPGRYPQPADGTGSGCHLLLARHHPEPWTQLCWDGCHRGTRDACTQGKLQAVAEESHGLRGSAGSMLRGTGRGWVRSCCPCCQCDTHSDVCVSTTP